MTVQTGNAVQGQFLGLPAKITIIVFWGMVALGVGGGFYILELAERQVRINHQFEAQYLFGKLESLIDRETTLSATHVPARLVGQLNDALAQTETVRGARILMPAQTLELGTLSGEPNLTQRLSVHTPVSGQHLSVDISIYQSDVAEILAKRRKQVLGVVGLSLLCFGILLQVLLRALISQPFERMIRVVRAYQSGDEASRFDVSRHDEFGYVARFFNAALDTEAERRRREMEKERSRADATEAALRLEREHAAITLDAIGDAVLRVNRHGRVTYANPAAEVMLAIPVENLIGSRLMDHVRLCNEPDMAVLADPLEKCLKGEVVRSHEHVVLVREDQSAVDVSFQASPIHGEDGGILGAVLVMHDTGNVRRLTRELYHQANHDALTGLRNRRGFELIAQQLVGQTGGVPHMLCLVDMDQFKLVNDICGHAAGDNLLREMADILREGVRDDDVVARLGGDEFALLLRHCDEAHALGIAEEILARTRHHGFECDGHYFKMGASIGVAAVGAEIKDISEALRAADMACYIAKEQGRGQAHLFSERDEATRQHQSNMHWVVRINRALLENEFRLYVQPVAPVVGRSGTSGYHEVLLRLAGEDGKPILPNAFLPAAERYDLMPAIDRWVVEKTLAAMNRCADRNVRLAINLSGFSLSEDSFLPYLLKQIDASGVAPQRLIFEITETATVSNLERVRELIDQLTARGCAFALDDFGSGVSSFAYLRELRVSHLKIDGRFVRRMLEDDVDYNIVGAACAVAGSLGIQTVAEWVENTAILERLHTLNVDYAQGFGIGMPVPIETLFNRATVHRIG